MTGREIERLLVVSFAGLAVYLGYRLFYLVKEKQGELKLKGQDWELGLADVAPGVYFALFGSLILVVSLWKQVQTESITEVRDARGTTARTVSRSIASDEPLADNTAAERCARIGFEASFCTFHPGDFADDKWMDYDVVLRLLDTALAMSSNSPLLEYLSDDAIALLRESAATVVTEQPFLEQLEAAQDANEAARVLHDYVIFLDSEYRTRE